MKSDLTDVATPRDTRDSYGNRQITKNALRSSENMNGVAR